MARKFKNGQFVFFRHWQTQREIPCKVVGYVKIADTYFVEISYCMPISANELYTKKETNYG